MTDFRIDILYFAELMARGEIAYFEVDNYGSYYEIATDKERRQYDCISEEKNFQKTY